MSEQTTETPAAPATPPPETPAQTWQKPPGYDPVDLDALGVTPEAKTAIEARIRHLYSQAKSGTEAKREVRELREHLEKLTPVVEQLTARETARTKETIESEIVRARDEGRVRDELKLQQELTALSAPKVEAPKAPVPTEAYVEAAQSWAVETNADGTLKRPWIAHGHPQRPMALGVMHELREEWEANQIPLRPENMQPFLRELDKRMADAMPKRPTQAAVLSTSQVNAPKKSDAELTQEEKHHAERLYQHIKEPAKRHEAYAKAKQLYGRN